MSKTGLNTPQDVKALVLQSLDADKALDVVSLELDEQSGIADYMVIASGTSSRHVGALAQKLKERLESRGLKNVRIEGMTTSDWVVIDAGDVIVHVFRPEVRSFYNLERMWAFGDAPEAPAQ
jgi:ribosome-associated protein